MSQIGHNKGPELGEIDFELVILDPESEIGKAIYEYIQKVSNGVFQVLIPNEYIIENGVKKFQIKPDAYAIFTYDEGKDFQVTGIEECIPEGFYKQAA